MEITGIICEYNPLHTGHFKQLSHLRDQNPSGGIVCLMSGNYVQRGMPAIFHKQFRASAAIACGADLVLELPVTAAVSSAENFASEGVRILGGFCDRLCFGAETPDVELLRNTAVTLLSEEFSQQLKLSLAEGCSFPAARQQALNTLGVDGTIIEKPNNILAVEYIKAITAQGSKMKPYPIPRLGDYHDTTINQDDPSATAIRQRITVSETWLNYVPHPAQNFLKDAAVHTLSCGEKAILAKLRTMTDDEFEALPYGSEGLWRKLMHASRAQSNLDNIISATKSKRYTRSRIDRMILCAFLGLTAQDIAQTAPYVRVLALNNRGREILRAARQTGNFPNIGEKQEHPFQQVEDRCDSLYGLFTDTPELPVQKQCPVYLDI